ncbi:MobH family relaxase [Sinimarinibacterium flocculans]|uniref:Integrating conjugative element relaxase (TIGR03760 family) n=1 Tax=Sinimarinibacterium flocculans TaxID=985250 RepID=A0A318E9P5_9GAMM|nr:MobH family relaxase [Sinimarinibacterium flocculans]PXV65729.1 integrating conjugative element relaxase (TIGR03760 family) [Sinimarinibacterium flocculans]
MLSLFQRKRVPPSSATPSTPFTETPKGLTRPESATSLLATPRRQKLLKHIWQRTSLSRQQFTMLYLAPLERYADLVQQFPASESHHHAYPGGMLDHGLEIVAYALKLRQSHLLPAGVTPEAQAVQAEAWTAGTAYAALLHDVGKIAVDLHVEHADGSVWHPWHGPLRRPYRFRYRKDREYRLHSAATGLLYTQILDRAVFDWLSGHPDLWTALLYVFAGQYEHAGTLGELVRRADQASVAHELGGDPGKALTAPRHALQRKLLDGLRYLLREELKLNQPQASDGWLTQDALWLVSKTVSDKLRAHLLSQGIDGIPASNTAVFNVLQDHGIALATPDGKAIWTATVTNGTWSHSFTFLKLSPAMIWNAFDRPPPFLGSVRINPEEPTTTLPEDARKDREKPASAITVPVPATPEDNGAESLLGLLDTPLPATAAQLLRPTAALQPASLPNNEADGTRPAQEVDQDNASSHDAHFLAWLRRSIRTRKLIINDTKALVHTVAGSVFLVSPGLFQRYAQEHPEIALTARRKDLTDWQWIQKRFEREKRHRKHPNGHNIWTCGIVGPRKSRRLHGYLLIDHACVFDDLPPDNPYLTLDAVWAAAETPWTPVFDRKLSGRRQNESP